MATCRTSIILTMLLSLLQVSARPASETPTPTPTPQLCSPLGHPDLKCGDRFTCEKGWPSETGNYGLNNLTVKLRARDAPLRVILLGENGTKFANNEHPSYQRRSPVAPQSQGSEGALVVGMPGLVIGPQCCRPTVECYKFFNDEVKLDGVDHNGRLLIDDLNDWKKAECCMSDFQQSQSWCLFPPARNRWIEWHEPPGCADVH
ncbi:uncharacterized protein Z520_11139 [Fonsecaea multimorphosa CBS 102226]|uniref:Uncharacterized protein n=1 Tax=Fonsecaea multimorphosa CBS 102226 TaxID=1442371 RepID=A0A0D2JIS1_9EURO|nr:uncharacterized protein Z520_11139 [Fonsecaea multimorphosa CBS 102226]KIX93082.1 hypothetical protein Z520_11139 [Fonsecaea multimorphosa CBS 102226]OAL18380.1 hypothetical protein AYO22_10700 [Fonsecaea multimorphosa]